MSISLSSDLIGCAYSELALSLEDRRKEVLRLKDNHYSFHAVGSIVLLVTGFDAWLNEGLWIVGQINKDILELADSPTMNKYHEIIKKLDGSIQPNNDLDLVIKLRDEIVHYLPRDISEKGPRRYLPKPFYALYQKGLFLSFPNHPAYEMPFGQQVRSFRLAYWAWETVDIAVNNFLSAFSSTKKPDFQFIYSTHNFKMYQRITPPDDFSTYDASNGIKLA